MFCLALFFVPIQFGFSRGDKLIPQVVDGPGWATKFDITNVSTSSDGNILGTMRLAFYHNDGTAWVLQTNQGTGSNFTLTLHARQTLRVETLGASASVSAGYAVVYDEEPQNSAFSEDFVLGISVYYVVLNGASVVDTVTIFVPPPTALAKLPVQVDDSKGINSGIAIANWAKASNSVKVDLYNESGVKYGSSTLTLKSGEQQAMYLNNESLFPGLTSYKGMIEITATGPVVVLGLLETRASDTTPRYSTLLPVDMESLRRNSYMVLLQADTDDNPYMPLDLDYMVSDFYRVTGNPDGYSWDLEYRYGSTSNTSDTSTRYLRVFNGATISALSGTYNGAQFDAISLPDLKGLTYSTSDVDLSGSNLYEQRAFAVKTDLGNYAKIRIFRIINTTANGLPYRDLILEVVIYR
jgi:hypothetical protein